VRSRAAARRRLGFRASPSPSKIVRERGVGDESERWGHNHSGAGSSSHGHRGKNVYTERCTLYVRLTMGPNGWESRECYG
jgi:hypothetical protein